MDIAERLDPTTRRVVLAVLRHGPVPRVELARETGLSSPSLTRLCKPLVADGLLVEGEPVALNETGRPSVPLDVQADRALVLGAKLVPGAMHLVLTDLKGQVLVSERRDCELETPEAAVAALVDAVEGVRHRGRRADAIGVSLAAAVGEDRVVRSADLLGWRDVALGALVSEATGLSCAVENDVNAFTVAEHWFGVGRGSRDFLVVTIGAGVGAGIIARDELVAGHRGAAGMVGWLVGTDGRRMADVLQTSAVEARLADEVSGHVAADVARVVGELVGQLGAVVAPERVLVSGEGAHLVEDRFDEVLAGARAFVPLEPSQLSIEAVGFDEWARGAAAVAIRSALLG